MTASRIHGAVLQAIDRLSAGQIPAARALLREATTLDPTNVDLRLALAFTHILVCEAAEALAIYDAVLRQHPDHTAARLLRAVYAGVAGEARTAEQDWSVLERSQPMLAARWRRSAARADGFAALRLTDQLPAVRRPGQHAIAVLGYVLNQDGTMSPQLRDRLSLALAAAVADPAAPLIVSGGVLTGGRSEAQAMADWLVRHGVAAHRVVTENQSFDTIENVLFTLRLAAAHGVRELTVVSSAHHSRRAAALFDCAADLLTLDLVTPIAQFHHLSAGLRGGAGGDAAGVGAGASPAERQCERLGIHRDVLRMNGLWAVPGYKR